MKKLILITAVLIGLINCTKHKAEPIATIVEVDTNCPDTILFSTQIMDDIFVTSCNGCHSYGGSGFSAGVFSSHSSISNDADKILKTLKHESGVIAMPYYNPMPLNDSLIKAFDCWIKQGKLNN
jgi:hypothetical protein